MKKIIYFIFLISFFVVSPTVEAQTASPSSFVSQATPSVTPNTTFVKSLNSFMGRLKAAVVRSENISQRIATRIIKLRLPNQVQVGNDKLVKLEAQQKTFSTNLKQLKVDLVQLDLASQALNTSERSKEDYLAFKNQVLIFTKNLKNVYKSELDLVNDMKKTVNPQGTSSAKVNPIQ